MLKIFITNLSEYNNGNLIGEWISLPTDSSFINQTINKYCPMEKKEENNTEINQSFKLSAIVGIWESRLN